MKKKTRILLAVVVGSLLASGTIPVGADVTIQNRNTASAADTAKAEEQLGQDRVDLSRNGIQQVGIRTYLVHNGKVIEISSGLYHLQSEITLPNGGDMLSAGDNYSVGIKVLYVCQFLVKENYLPERYENCHRYLSEVADAVQAFQKDQGLMPDGIVDLAVWRAMGYTAGSYYDLSRYVIPQKLTGYGHSRDEYIQAMLETAAEYAEAETPYLDGAAGAPGTYIDCSGLIYEILYSVGIDPDTNVLFHSRSDYEYGSYYLGNDPKLGVEVDLKEIEPGDLVFYSQKGRICHVAIYVGQRDGKDLICDAYADKVAYRTLEKQGYEIAKVVRIF